MAVALKRIPALFYHSRMGSEPAREWLKELPPEDRRIIGFHIATAEFGWPIGMPLCRSMGAGLWEIRSKLDRGRIARIFFCVNAGHLVLLHGFVKKSQKTPAFELELARKRQTEIER